MNATIRIEFDEGIELHCTVTDEINSLIQEGHEFNIKTVHPSHGHLIEITPVEEAPFIGPQLIKSLKHEMARFLDLSPDDENLTFNEYFKIADGRPNHQICKLFSLQFAGRLAGVASLMSPATPNVIFGVLTNGEIFVEVNGQQHTPADAFYKMATIQSTKLAHQVRDLTVQNEKLAKENATLRDQRGADKTALYSISEILDKWHEVEE